MNSRQRSIRFSASGKPRKQRIIVFDEGVSLSRQKEVLANCRGHILRELPSMNALVVLVDDDEAAEVQALADSRAGIVRIDDDLDIHLVSGLGAMSWKPAFKEEMPWGVARLNLGDLPYTGKGVKVAVLDTGIDTSHPDLRPVANAGISVIDGVRSSADDNGHGTHVAGTIGAQRNGYGVVGVAPGVQLYPVKVLDDKGSGKLSNLIAGMDWCVQNQIRIMNLSLSSSKENQTFRDAIIKARKAGITMVCAAGNSGPAPNTIGYPARYLETVSVAAMDENNAVADFSSRGREVALIAPGVNIMSTWPRRRFRSNSGTSMASPHVTGVVALMLEADPSLTPSDIKAVLQATAIRLKDASSDAQGAGFVNASAAVSKVGRKKAQSDAKAGMGA